MVKERVLVAQSCPTFWDPMDCSPPDSSVHGILQARILEWVVIFFSRGSSWPRDRTQVSCIAGRFFTIWATSCAVLSCSVLSYSLDPLDCSPPGCSVRGDSPGKNTGMGSHALLQGNFPTQGSDPGLLNCRWTLYHLSDQRSSPPPFFFLDTA